MKRRPPTIVVSGLPGSGKSTLARMIAERLKLQYYSTGLIFREMARRRGLSLEELSKLAEQDPEIDREIDSRTIEVAKKGGVVIDSHLAAWLLRDIADVKVGVIAPLRVRVERIARRENRDPEEVERETRYREESEKRRFWRYYRVDLTDLSVFDIVINTATYNPEDALELALHAIDLVLKRRREQPF